MTTNHATTAIGPAPWFGSGLYRFIVDRFLLLPLGALIAFVWANLEPVSYFSFAGALAFPVNEIGMAFFLALIAQDLLDAMAQGGALQTWRKWGLSIIAGLGAFAGATLTYLLYVSIAHEGVLRPVWPAAAAIDIAAGYYLLKLLLPRNASIPFLVAIAVVNDGILMAMASRPIFAESFGTGLPLILIALLLATVLRSQRYAPAWIFAIAGPVIWLGFRLEGLHPALALLPLVAFLPHVARRSQLFGDITRADAGGNFEHHLNEAVQVVLFLFGLVNAGVLLRGYDTGTWAVLAAALIGRPLGLIVAVALGSLVGMHLPSGMHWRHVIVVALATTSGFTFALFYASVMVPAGGVLTQLRIGALATAGGAAITVLAARVLRVGLFSPAARPE
jgi:NhaA family Na+:H+ antiporter